MFTLTLLYMLPANAAVVIYQALGAIMAAAGGCFFYPSAAGGEGARVVLGGCRVS